VSNPKKQIYLHEFNIIMGNKIFLPNVSGMLRAFAETKEEITSNYEFMPFVFIRGKLDTITKLWDKPDIMAFSSSIWNHQLNLAVAKKAREMFPQALIVFGGPHVPNDGAEVFLRENEFIDLIVIKDGEATFSDILITFLKTRDFSDVQGVAFLHPNTKRFIRTLDRPTEDVNVFPSPYVAGLYDYLLNERGDTEYQVILETNRGCPFECGFCYWGSRNKRVRMFDLNRIRQEVAWIGKHRIEYVFGADANFGMIPRDLEVASIFVESKKSIGFPRSFRVCYGKNAEDRVFTVAQLLDAVGLTKGVTVSFQSTDPQTLKNIGRGNISLNVYRNLLKRYRERKIQIYTELILGMPGETYESFTKGLNEVFEAGLYDQIGIFFCIVLPNTPMANPDYIKEHEIIIQQIELVEPHASKRKEGEIQEYEDIIIATKTMPLEEWKKTATMAWVAQTLHGLKLGFFVALYLFNRFGIKYTEFFSYLVSHGYNEKFPVFKDQINQYKSYLERVISGDPQCVFIDEFGEISWQIEEATFLKLSENLKTFYEEFFLITQNLLKSRGVPVDNEELREVFRYQIARIASLDTNKPKRYQFSYNIPEYFDRLLNDQEGELIPPQDSNWILDVDTKKYHNKKDFATQIIWYGRRDSRAVEPVTWFRDK